MKNNQQGFATLMLLSLLPLILAGGLALLSIFGFLKSDLATMNLCRSRQIEVQNKVGRNLAKLLALNPRALKLRLTEVRAQRMLTLALESGNIPAVAAAEAYLLSVQMRRQALDLRQRALIDTANLWLSSASYALPRELRQEWWQHNKGLSSWLKNSLSVSSAEVPTLAVQPDIPEVAPAYLLKTSFAEAQAWKQNWSLHLQTTSWAAKFFRFNGDFERSCSTSLYSKGDEWIARMKKDKSLLKAF